MGVQVLLVTVKPAELLLEPDTVTVTFTAPAARLDGTVAVMDEADHEVTAALVPPKLTVLDPCDDPKFEPLMVTDDPAAPEVGLREVMLGAVVPLDEVRIPNSVYAGTVTVKVLPNPLMVLS